MFKNGEKVKKTVEKVEDVVQDKKQAEENARLLINSQNTEKAHKDLMLKNIKELEKHRADVQGELGRLSTELENKHRALKMVDDEIKSKTFTLAKQQDQFEKQHSERVRQLEKGLKDVEASDAEYKRLNGEMTAKVKDLNAQLGAIAEERKTHTSEMNRMKRHVSDVEAEDAKIREDIKEREAALAKEREEFEAEKESLSPELKRISSIKNENDELYRRLEEEKAQFQRQQDIFDGHRQKMDADAKAGKEALERMKQGIVAEEARLRKWEEDLADFDLEIKAREADADKAKRRYQLTQTIEEGKEEAPKEQKKGKKK